VRELIGYRRGRNSGEDGAIRCIHQRPCVRMRGASSGPRNAATIRVQSAQAASKADLAHEPGAPRCETSYAGEKRPDRPRARFGRGNRNRIAGRRQQECVFWASEPGWLTQTMFGPKITVDPLKSAAPARSHSPRSSRPIAYWLRALIRGRAPHMDPPRAGSREPIAGPVANHGPCLSSKTSMRVIAK
jgi:hypothetical protein